MSYLPFRSLFPVRSAPWSLPHNKTICSSLKAGTMIISRCSETKQDISRVAEGGEENVVNREKSRLCALKGSTLWQIFLQGIRLVFVKINKQHAPASNFPSRLNLYTCLWITFLPINMFGSIRNYWLLFAFHGESDSSGMKGKTYTSRTDADEKEIYL